MLGYLSEYTLTNSQFYRPHGYRDSRPSAGTIYPSVSELPDDVFGAEKTHVEKWAHWRTHLNEKLIDVMERRKMLFSQPGSVRIVKKQSDIFNELTSPTITIGKDVSDFALRRAVHDYMIGQKGFNLDAEAFLSFGLPRIRLVQNKHYVSETAPPVEERDDQDFPLRAVPSIHSNIYLPFDEIDVRRNSSIDKFTESSDNLKTFRPGLSLSDSVDMSNFDTASTPRTTTGDETSGTGDSLDHDIPDEDYE